MATVQDKMESMVYAVCGSLLTITCALLGGPLWSIIITVQNSFHITGDAGMSNLHAVQPVPMIYYGFLVVFEIALIVRTVFVVWSRTTYETGW